MGEIKHERDVLKKYLKKQSSSSTRRGKDVKSFKEIRSSFYFIRYTEHDCFSKHS